VYGIGGFLLAGSQMVELLLKHSGNDPVISLYNKTGMGRNEEVVEIPFPDFSSKIKNYKNGFKITDALTGKEIEYQLEYRGHKDPVNVLVLVNLAPGSEMYARISNGKPSDFTPKTYARFVPERYDDFAWENDKIAFRVYGAALEKIPNEMAYGQDVWGKRTSKMIINEWYKGADYHADHGEGLDFYDVGLTLGAGGNAPFVHDSIYYSKNFRRNKVLDNGPLRSAFQLEYDPWNVNGTMVKKTKIISIDAGSQLSKVETSYSFKGKEPLPVAIGIVEHQGNSTILLNERNGVVGYWEPQHGKDGTLGIGVIIPSENKLQMTIAKEHLLGIIPVLNGKTFSYYSGAAWDRAGVITDSHQWFSYLDRFRKKLDQPVIVNWVNN